MGNRVFSAPGRVEIGGNHTDHQHGMVLTAAVDLKIWCLANPNGTNVVNVKNTQYPSFSVDLSDLNIYEKEKETSAALVRGVAAWFKAQGHKIGGFDANISSNIPVGAGLSSSAAYEVLIGNVFKGLFGCAVTPLDIAIAGQYAENNFFGKPCGLMDQAASSFGGLNMINFADPQSPVITPIKANFQDYVMCIVETGASHVDLTPKYAAIPHEMMIVASHFGKEFLQDIQPETFYAQIGWLRNAGLSDRAILRAIHFFEENKRVERQAAALQQGNMRTFLDLVNTSGRSSLAYLQNVFTPADTYRQDLTIALALSEKKLAGRGAWRIHGGGFAGTILAFVPSKKRGEYEGWMNNVFGADSCHFLNVCAAGGGEVSN